MVKQKTILILMLILCMGGAAFAGGGQETASSTETTTQEEVSQNGKDEAEEKKAENTVSKDEAGMVSGEEAVVDKPLATVSLTKTQPISYQQFIKNIRYVEAQAQGQKIPVSDYETLLDQAIRTILLQQAAERDGVTITESEIMQTTAQQIAQQVGQQPNPDQIKALVQQQYGITWSQYVTNFRKTQIAQKYLQVKAQDELRSVEQPTNEEIQEAYNENLDEFVQPDIVAFSHIFLACQKEEDFPAANQKAREILSRIQNSVASFEQMVRQESQDSQSKQRSGYVGFISKDDAQVKALFGEEFLDELYTMGVNDMKVIQSSRGVHIVKVTEIQKSRQLSLDDPISPDAQITVRQLVGRQLYNYEVKRIFQQVSEEVVAKLRSEAEINIFEENFDW